MDHISVKYTGKRAEYTDGTYGTRILFKQGESRMVPLEKARLMLKHPDVYVSGDADAPLAIVQEPKQEADDVQDMRDAIANMGKDALSAYAKSHYNIKIDKRKDVGALRSEVTGLVDQFGAI